MVPALKEFVRMVVQRPIFDRSSPAMASSNHVIAGALVAEAGKMNPGMVQHWVVSMP
jgi:hypothetical protein